MKAKYGRAELWFLLLVGAALIGCGIGLLILRHWHDAYINFGESACALWIRSLMVEVNRERRRR